jgi:hypothetical protein
MAVHILTETLEPLAIPDCLSLMDPSHFNWEFFDFYLKNNFYPICLPVHSTHLLQPLDVGLFGPLQRAYTTELEAL